MPFAVVDAAEVTAIRTAAASAVATRLLAREDSTTLAILGYGAQAHRHLDAMRVVRPIDRVQVWGRDPAKAARFAADHDDINVEVRADPRSAISGADIICTVTASPTPIVAGKWLEPGQHINAVGTSFPGLREIDGEGVARSRLFVDNVDGAIAQAGEFGMARDEGLIDESHIVGVPGDIAEGRVAGRTSESDITMYKSLGLVVQDLAAAHHVYTKAVAADIGVSVDF